MSSCLEKPKALTLRISSAQVQAFFFIPLKIHKGTHKLQWNEQRCKVNLRIWRASNEWRKGDSHLATPNKCKLIHFYSVAGGWSKSSLHCCRLNADDALVESGDRVKF